MKRSEALSHIDGTIMLTIADSEWTSQAENRAWLANLILQRLEEAGIQPPTITVMPNSYNRSEGKMGFDVNEWEPEDE